MPARHSTSVLIGHAGSSPGLDPINRVKGPSHSGGPDGKHSSFPGQTGGSPLLLLLPSPELLELSPRVEDELDSLSIPVEVEVDSEDVEDPSDPATPEELEPSPLVPLSETSGGEAKQPAIPAHSHKHCCHRMLEVSHRPQREKPPALAFT